MAGVNKVIILGRLGSNPELKNLENGTKLCTISIATSEKIKDKEVTEWHSVILFDKQAELTEKYLKKGNEVYIEGKIRTRQWEDQNNQKKYKTEIIANHITFVSTKSNDEQGSNKVASQGSNEEVPF